MKYTNIFILKMIMYIYCVFVDLVFNITLHQGEGDGG
jgi:hypothetical protein